MVGAQQTLAIKEQESPQIKLLSQEIATKLWDPQKNGTFQNERQRHF